MGIRVIVAEFEVLEGEGVNVFDFRIHPHGGELFGCALQLEFSLIKVVLIEVEISEGVNEVTSFVSTYLSDHHGEKSVGGDVKGDAEEEVCTALIELAGETRLIRVDIMHVELKEHVAGRESHFINFSYVPR